MSNGGEDMRKFKIISIILLTILMSIFCISCNSSTEEKETNDVKEEIEEKKQENKEEDKKEIGVLYEKEHIEDDNMILSFDKELIKKIEKEYKLSPERDIITYAYISTPDDVICFDDGDILNTISIKPYPNIKITGINTYYEWDDLNPIIKTANTKKILQDGNYYEGEVYEEASEINLFYYDKESNLGEKIHKIAYDVMADGKVLYTEENGYINYNIMKEYIPSINPLELNPNEKINFIEVTKYNDKPAIYLEIIASDKFKKEWVSIRTGLLLREEEYNGKGLIVKVYDIDKIELEDVSIDSHTEFYEAQFRDITILEMEEKGISKNAYEIFEIIANAIYDHDDKHKGEFEGIKLLSDKNEYNLYFKGGSHLLYGFNINNPVYVYPDPDSGELMREIPMTDKFYNVYDNAKMAVVHKDSCWRKEFFNCLDTIFMGVKENGNKKEYSFYQYDSFSSDGLHNVYTYVVEDQKLIEIRRYKVEFISKTEPKSEVEVFQFKKIDYDENVHDESFMINYSIDDLSTINYDGKWPICP